MITAYLSPFSRVTSPIFPWLADVLVIPLVRSAAEGALPQAVAEMSSIAPASKAVNVFIFLIINSFLLWLLC